jgi:hypothetical protein
MTMRALVCFLCIFAMVGSAAITHAASDTEVEARKVALELAGAFSNDGFKLRDGCWTGTLEPGKAYVAQVNLYAGNQYWFSVGAASAAKKIAVTLHDEMGAPLPVEPYAAGATAAAGFSPEASGPYYVRIEGLEGGTASFCLLYSYK